MDRIEGSPWTLARGAFSVFALAVVLKEAPWRLTFAVLVIVVSLWALRATVVVGGALGVIAWACHTGFDVAKTGELVFSGAADAVRLGALAGAGLVAALAAGPSRAHRPPPSPDGITERRSGNRDGDLPAREAPRQLAVVPDHPTEESRDV